MTEGYSNENDVFDDSMNLFNKKDMSIEAAGQAGTSNDLVQCYVNKDNTVFLNGSNVFQSEDGEIYYAYLTSNEYGSNEQSIQLIPQSQLSQIMMTDESYAVDGSNNFININESNIKYYDPEFISKAATLQFQECTICAVKFSSRRTYQKHMLIHENDREFKCSWCKLSYNHEVNLLVHVAVLHTDECVDKSKSTSLKCPLCDCTFSRKKALQGHCLVHQIDEELSCSHCSQQFKSIVVLTDHLSKVEKGEISSSKCAVSLLKCKICQAQFENVGNMKKHYAKEHPKGKTDWVDPTLVETVVSIDKEDADVSNPQIPIEEESGTENNVNKRKSSKKAIQTIKLYAQGRFRSAMKKSNERTRGRPRRTDLPRDRRDGYKCDVCNKMFKTPILLKRHEVTHTGEKAFECSVCCKRFTQKSSVKIHMAVHQGTKEFQCSYCNKSFTYEHNMNTHIRIVHRNNKDQYTEKTRYNKSRDTSTRLKRKRKAPTDFTMADENEISQYLWNENTTEQHEAVVYQPNSESNNNYIPSSVDWDKQPHATANHGILLSERVEKVDRITGTVQVHEIIKDNVTGFKRYRCQFCYKIYRTSSELTQHIRIHTNERPYQCYMCHRRFRLRSVLQTHYKTH